ncbi:MAG: hypothetical protein IJV11_09450 [Muribaculaceae bacterium]|nr:hypothetical protein [Muribaculaceae bacterium]
MKPASVIGAWSDYRTGFSHILGRKGCGGREMGVSLTFGLQTNHFQ